MPVQQFPRVQTCVGTVLLAALFVVGMWPTAGCSTAAQSIPGKLPVPEGPALTKALGLVAELYRDEYQNARTDLQKRALAEKLINQAKQTPDDPAGRFALLRVARDMATGCGDVSCAAKAIEAIQRNYRIDAVEMTAEMLAKASSAARSSPQRKAVARLALATIDQAVAADNYSQAAELGELAAAAARQAGDRLLVKEIADRVEQVAAAAHSHEAVASALATLNSNPADPQANLAAGRHLCLVKGQWDQGVSMLAIGADSPLKDQAGKDLRGATDPAQQAALGDGWWDLASAEQDPAAGNLRRRAAHWYRKSLEGLDGGLTKIRIEKRLGEVAAAAPDTAETAVVAPPTPKDKEIEAAVDAGLKWLTAKQLANGGWSFLTTPDPATRQDNLTAATAMALLPLLGAGHNHQEGKHAANVRKGLTFLLANMKTTPYGGDLRGNQRLGATYTHALATIALCEAYRQTKDRKLRTPAQAAVNFTLYFQDPVGGGFRYQPKQKGDTSVTGWHTTALSTASGGGLKVGGQAATGVMRFLDGVQDDGGAAYGYTTSSTATTTSAIGLLCRLELGWQKDNPALQRGIARMVAEGPEEDLYYTYYSTRLMQRFGGDEWKQWKQSLKDLLLEMQEKQGLAAGSWYSRRQGHSVDNYCGRLGLTSLALISLVIANSD